MTEFDLVIRGGTVVTAADTFRADVGVREGRIAALGEDLAPGGREIDATGRLVMPGGIDSHCHIDQPSSMGGVTADDFRSGSISAAAGGTTTIIPFAAQHRGQSLRAVVDDYHARAEGKAVIDYAFHLIISDPTEVVMKEELPALIRDGYTSFKVYMTYDALKLDDRQMLEVMALAREEGAMLMVHAENHDVISWLAGRLEAAGRSAPKFHGVAHHPVAESEATHRAIALARIVDVPLLVVHVSGREAAEEIRRAKAAGLPILGETCPQYLFLSAEDMDRPGFEGAKFMCSPPPREQANQEHIWNAIASGVFDVVSSDHAPYAFDSPEGKKLNGDQAPFKKIPNGVPGIAARLPLLFSGGVNGGRISLNQFVALAATNAAKLYGLYPRKGAIAVGADADIALWDPEREVTLTLDLMHDAMDYTPYEGIAVKGWPMVTLCRGEVVCEDFKPRGEAGRGQFLSCDRPEPAARHTPAFWQGD